MANRGVLKGENLDQLELWVERQEVKLKCKTWQIENFILTNEKGFQMHEQI